MRPYSEAEKASMSDMYRSGKSLKTVAAAHGRSLYGVYYAIKKMGVEVRTQSEAQTGRCCAGRKKRGPHSEEARRKMSASAKARGASHNWFVDGDGQQRDTKRRQDMDRLEYRLWRESVFKRDGFTCQMCRQVGGELQADHIKGWASHPALRYEVDNGRTLCRTCHHQTDNFGAKARLSATELSSY
jgi:HNH endonuclease